MRRGIKGRVLFGTLIHYIMLGKIIAIQFAAETARSQIRGNALASGAPPSCYSYYQPDHFSNAAYGPDELNCPFLSTRARYTDFIYYMYSILHKAGHHFLI